MKVLAAKKLDEKKINVVLNQDVTEVRERGVVIKNG